MKSEFITYQKFNEVEFANELIKILEENHIPFLLEEEGPVFDPSFSYRADLSWYNVKVRNDDFEQVNQLLASKETGDPPADTDYYLFDFTDGELIDLIEKADEWSAYDVALAQKILIDRGKPVSEGEIDKLKAKRLEELKAPETSQKSWLVIGYIFAFAGGILGMFVGWHLITYRKTLPNGERVLNYSEYDRKQGKIILFISIASTILWLIIRLIAIYEY